MSHWHDLDRQVRIKGTRHEGAPEADSVAYWNSRPRASRLSAWASRQSETVGEPRAARGRGRRSSGSVSATTATFRSRRSGAATWSTPDDVEFWQHRDDRLHDRLRYRREPAARNGWVLERLQP